ncbi:helix-turn-helix domain-containing protein [Undibacterium sp. Ji83W]|uniref:helix-turn-helix domain-containing protein n=1 Tax=Undibacterium sp. Ji83W TaxID=3413043 RepID=UPI003BF1B666
MSTKLPANNVVTKRKPSQLPSRIGKNVATKRKNLGLTQEQLAARVGVEVETISRLERGVHSPSLAMLEILSEELNIAIADLLEEKALVPTPESEIIATYLNKLKVKDRLFLTDFVKLYFQRHG